MSLYRSNRLTACGGGGGGSGGGAGSGGTDSDGGQVEQYGSPGLSNFQNLIASNSSRFHDSSRSDPEKAAMVSDFVFLFAIFLLVKPGILIILLTDIEALKAVG
ncbi:unnamed protein product [Trichobilharzia regenti]|nr:unnamed protein product [Trichobilharzia regenti]